MVNTALDLAVLDCGTVIPILDYYDHSGDMVPVEKDEATQVVAGNDENGYYCIQLADFGPRVLH